MNMNDFKRGKNILERYCNFPCYIIGNPKMDTQMFSQYDYHKIKIGELLQSSKGIILKTQRQRLELTRRLIAYFYKFGLKEIKRGEGKIKDINKKNNTYIINIIIALEMIGKLRL